MSTKYTILLFKQLDPGLFFIFFSVWLVKSRRRKVLEKESLGCLFDVVNLQRKEQNAKVVSAPLVKNAGGIQDHLHAAAFVSAT